MKKTILSFLFILSMNTNARDGDLDTSFGIDGKVTNVFDSVRDIAYAAILQPDGKIVAAGLSGFAPVDFIVVRYNTGGSLDTSFGTDGKVITDFGEADQANAVLLQADGKIVAAGKGGSSFSGNFALARYHTNGSLDTSFGTDGKVTTDLGGNSDQANAIILQPDGKIIAAGTRGFFFSGDFGLARYRTNGSLDTSFGADGIVITDFGGTDQANAVILQPDGRIIAVGQGNNDFALACYDIDGSLDTSFGTDGKVTTDFGGTDQANAVLLQLDGKIVVAGKGNGDFALARYNMDGSLDISFGTDGKVTTDFEGTTDQVNAVLLQPDGKIVAVGSSKIIGLGEKFALARYNTDGSLDTSFGTDGIVTTDFGGDDTDRANAALLQPDGKIVAVGLVDVLERADFGLARYLIPSLEVSSLARDLRAKYFLLQ